VGIREVATTAGVSPTTVSHALNGKGRISAETREKIVAVARDLNYVPNRNAQNLVRGDQMTVALRIAGNVEGAPVFTNWDVEYFMRLVTGAFAAANQANLTLVYRSFDGDVDIRLREEEEEGEAREEVQGLIEVDPPGNPRLNVGSQRPIVVTTGRIPPTAEDPEPDNPYWVDNDNLGSTRMMLDHMVEQGARSIAMIAPLPITSVTVDCEEAYVKWKQERGEEPRIDRADRGISETAGAQAAGELLDGSDAPDAIFSTMQGLAVGALHAAQQRKIKVPDDLMIAAYCDGLGGEGDFASITAIDLAPEEVGANAIYLMADLLNGREPEEPQIIVPTVLMERNSTLRKSRRKKG